MAVSGHAVAEVEHNEKGRPALKSAARIEDPSARGSSNFLFVSKTQQANQTWRSIADARRDLSPSGQRKR